MYLIRFITVCIVILVSLTLLELSDPPIFIGEIGWWFAGVLLIAYVVCVEGKQVSSLGLRTPSISTISTATVGFGLALCGVATFGLITLLTGVDSASTEQRLDQTAAAPLWWLVLVFLRAGVIEELFFRGFVISRAIELGAPRWLSLLFSTTLFVLPHALFWPGPSLIMVALTGLAMGIIFVWKRDLLACVLAHIGVNTGGVIATILN